jgi:hypothetical protein
VEERFQTGKGLVGLDQHQVRRWRSWYRWVALVGVATPTSGTRPYLPLPATDRLALVASARRMQ